MARILRALAPRVAIAVDALKQAVFGDDAGSAPQDNGLGVLAPTIADQDRAQAIIEQETQRGIEARQYLRLRNDYFKNRVGANLMDGDGKPSGTASEAERLLLRTKFDQMPDLVRSEREMRDDTRSGGRLFPQRSIEAAREFDRELGDPDGHEFWRDPPVKRAPIHATERKPK
jgi:hypothetical protein